MDIICFCLGVLSLVAGLFAGFEDLLTAVSAISAGLSLLIASKILSNQKEMVATYNPQNEACNAHKTKRAKTKTKRAKNIKRNVPTERFFRPQ